MQEFQAIRARDLTFRLGFLPSEPSVVGMLTSLFVHAGWLHLLGNMLFLNP